MARRACHNFLPYHVNFNFYLFNQPLFINLFIRFIFTSINILIIILIFAKNNRKAPSYFHRTTANTQRIRTIKSGKKAITFDPVLATRRPNLARGGVVAATADGKKGFDRCCSRFFIGAMISATLVRRETIFTA